MLVAVWSRSFIYNLLMTPLFCEATWDYIVKLRAILNFFKRISGLMVNLKKFKVAGLNLADGELFVYAGILGCEQESWPSKYLGFPLWGNPRSLNF